MNEEEVKQKLILEEEWEMKERKKRRVKNKKEWGLQIVLLLELWDSVISLSRLMLRLIEQRRK